MKKYFLIITIIISLLSTAYSSTMIPDNMMGVYKFNDSVVEKKQFKNSINNLIKQIPFLMRPFVSSKLKKGFIIPEKIKFFSSKPGEISIKSDMKSIVSTDLIKTPVTYKNSRGKQSKLLRELVGTKIYEKIIGKSKYKSSRINSYKFSEDGTKMVYTVKLKGEILKDPLIYKLTFTKMN